MGFLRDGRHGRQLIRQQSMLLLAILAAPLLAEAANINFDYIADVGTAPGEILLHQEELNVPGGPVRVSRTYTYNFDGAQPLSTATSIGLNALTEWTPGGNKRVALSANAEAYISAFDVLHPPPPHQGTIEATVKTHLDAVITIGAPGVADGQTVTFNLLNPFVHGALEAPAALFDGSGLASISGLFVMFEYSTDFFGNRVLGASKAKSFEAIAETLGQPSRTFSQGGSMSLEPVAQPGGPPPVGNANPDFTVTKGQEYLVVLEFYARVSLLPVTNVSGAPSKHIFSSASFDSTMHWAGFSDFADANGVPLANVQLLDESGVDWATASAGAPVPLPPALSLLLGGCGLLACRRRSR